MNATSPLDSSTDSGSQQTWRLSPNSSISTPLPRRANSKKPSSLVVYPPLPTSHQQYHPQPTATTSTGITASTITTATRNKKNINNHYGHTLSSPVNGDGLFLASPPPTATRLPNSHVLRMPRLHQTFDYIATSSKPGVLPSHRVGFAEYGDLENGYPTMVIGGHGCSRLVGIMFEELAQRHGLRMIWPERPGYGLSEECSPQKLNALDWAEVVIQLANHLGINTFSIIGQSVGTVFAMAIAHQYSHRVMGPMYMISPWVSTQQANTFKWSRRLPASLVTRTLSFAMDVMWLFNKPTAWDSSTDINSPPLQSPPPLFSSSSTTTTSSSISYGQHIQQQEEENEFLASLEGEDNLPTDFPPHRPLRHMVRPRHVSLYVAMNKYRMAEPYQSGQLGDVLVALEKYHEFGFSYDGQSTPVAVSAVWGDQDSLIPQRAIDCFANQIRDIRLKILEGEGHDLIWKEGVMAWAIRSIGERWRATEGRSS